MTKIEGSRSESGSISASHGSADPDQLSDPHKNFMDPEHGINISYKPMVSFLKMN
jgi:hypothetical protein